MTELYEFKKSQESVDPEELRVLARDRDSSIRMYVAENPHTPIDTLSFLTTDLTVLVRLYSLRNPNLPLDLVKRLTNDEDKIIRREAALRILRLFMAKKLELPQKEVADYIRIIEPNFNNLDTIEALENILQRMDQSNA